MSATQIVLLASAVVHTTLAGTIIHKGVLSIVLRTACIAAALACVWCLR